MRTAITLVTILVTSALFADAAVSPPAPHDGSRGVSCASCHTSHRDNLSGARLFNNACLSCHRPGDPRGGTKPFTVGDQADPFDRYTAAAPKNRSQTSHRFDGTLVRPDAGADLPTTPELAGKLPMVGTELACTLCHNQHDNTNGKFLRISNDRDRLCLDCHRSRDVQSHTGGSHPVMVGYSAAWKNRTGAYRRTPLNANPFNPTSDLGGHLTGDDRVVCSTCHAVHYGDSRSSTVDGAPGFTNLSSGDGNLLRTDLKGKRVDPRTGDYLTICTNCHAGKFTHNGRGQNIQCTDCHGAHVGKNVSLIRERMDGAPLQTIYTSTTRKNFADGRGTGVCQSCHPIPQGAGYPVEHATLTGCTACHIHGASRAAGGSFSPIAGSCTSCHGYPPVANTPGGPDGFAPGSPFTEEATSGHRTHASKEGYAKQCIECHLGNSHRSGTFADLFIETGPLLSRFSSAGIRPAYDPTTMTCSGVYCHGNGAPRGGTLITRTTPSWARSKGGGLGAITQNPDRCNFCHAGTASALTTNAHGAHLSSGTSCSVCHLLSPADASFVPYSGNLHVNGSKDVRFGSQDSGGSWAPAAGTCTSLYCHGNGQTPPTYAVSPPWQGGTATCTSCHGDASTGTLSAPHDRHVNNAAALGTNYGCVDCHARTVSSNSVVSSRNHHVNRFKDVSGARVRPMSPAQVDNGTCSSYCHSNGAGGAPNQSVSWSGITTLDCNGCHNALMTSSGHSRHVGSTADCVRCHRTTTSTGTAILPGSTTHTNMTVDVRLAKANSFTGYSGSFNPSSRSCSSTYCHGGTNSSPAWGTSGSLFCSSCHEANGTTLPAGHSFHVAPTAPTSYAAQPANTSSPTITSFTCSSCHGNSPSSHADGPVAAGSDATIFFGFSSAGRNPAYPRTGASFTDSRGFKYQAGSPGACSATYCHSDGKGNDGAHSSFTWTSPQGTLGCTGCHGDAASGTLSSRHRQHLRNYSTLGTGNGFGCVDCHARTVSSDTTIADKSLHVNKLKDYSGARAGRTAAAGQCTAIYCHSSGQATPVYRNMTGSKGWYGSAALDCRGCHGYASGAFPSTLGEPNYANGGAGSPTANSHQKHVEAIGIQSTTQCADCHAKTVDPSTPNRFRDYTGGTYHINRQRDVVFSPIEGLTGSYDPATKSCSATYCHGTPAVLPQWGANGSLSCASCHPANNTLGGAHSIHYASATLPSKFINFSGNVSSATSYRFTCSSCHAAGNGKAEHARGRANQFGMAQVFFGVTSAGRSGIPYDYAGSTAGTDSGTFTWTAGGTAACVTSYCHSDGKGNDGARPVNWGMSASGASCTGCHGDASTGTLSTPHGRHVGSSGYAFGCETCHSATVSASSTISDKSKHVNRVKDVAFQTAVGGSWNGTQCSNTYCHSNGRSTTAPFSHAPVSWGGTMNCTSCHGDAASGTLSAPHDRHVNNAAALGTNYGCVDCHARTVSSNSVVSSRNHHVNRFKDVSGARVRPMSPAQVQSGSCSSSCHGSYNPPLWQAPAVARALCTKCHGTPSTTDSNPNRAPAIGAHQAHVGGTGSLGYARPVGCSECHNQGTTVSFTVHMNGAIDVTFANASTARKNGVAASWTPASLPNGTCSVYCHGTSMPRGDTSGTMRTPSWTADILTGNRGNDCGTCHGNPPTTGSTAGTHAGKAPTTSCSGCHPHFNPTGGFDSDANRRLHLNGQIDASGACDSCHGYPPASGKHTRHAGTGSYQYSCAACHYSTTRDGSSLTAGGTHNDGTRNVVFVFYTSAEPILRSTTSWSPVSLECSNIYCHSDGRSMTPTSPAISWITGGLGGQCSDCHKGPAAMDSGSHQQHFVRHAIQCSTCHQSTIQLDPTYGVVSRTTHVNQRADISLYNVGASAKYDGYSAASPANFAKIPGRAPGSCSSTTCHGSTSPVWGENTGEGCALCHSYDVTGSEFTAGVWRGGYWGKFPQSTPDRFGAHAKHINHIKTRLGYSTTLNPQETYGAAGSDNLKVCGTCHTTVPEDHMTGGRRIFTQSIGTHPYTMGGAGGTSLLFGSTSPAYDPVTGTCSNLSCHYFTSPAW